METQGILGGGHFSYREQPCWLHPQAYMSVLGNKPANLGLTHYFWNNLLISYTILEGPSSASV
eukprot:COSAG01_NODE_8190_length_2885_cov_2.173367_2_plen_63_part_00